jgi:hypothetical protein
VESLLDRNREKRDEKTRSLSRSCEPKAANRDTRNGTVREKRERERGFATRLLAIVVILL